VAAALQGSVRQHVDIAARYGGEEFAVIMPSVDADTARAVAERMRAAVTGLLVPHSQSDFGFVSVSIGIAALIPSGDMVAEELIHIADRALYDAKRNGRDQVCQIFSTRLGLVDRVVTGFRHGAYAPVT
jgi:diguanylate cyclase (GGDEF)-like protein